MKRKAVSLAIVNTTVGSAAEARKLTSAVIESRLAACVQSLPIQSVYRWRGKVESAQEFLLLMKTRRTLVKPLIAFIKRHHSYEVPEILATPVTNVYEKYREWVEIETKRK